MTFTIVPTRPEMAERLAEIQRLCFPTLSERELLTPAHYRAHIKMFPEGQHVALDDTGTPVACSTDMRVRDADIASINHRYMEMTGDNWLTTHRPDGDWLYGVDIGVHPDFRGKKLSEMLYNARKDLIRRLNLKGHVAGGMIKGYYKYKDSLSAEDYVAKVAKGEIFDPVLSIQLRRGFTVRGIINDYLDDPSCDNKAAFIVWNNPDYKA